MRPDHPAFISAAMLCEESARLRASLLALRALSTELQAEARAAQERARRVSEESAALARERAEAMGGGREGFIAAR